MIRVVLTAMNRFLGSEFENTTVYASGQLSGPFLYFKGSSERHDVIMDGDQEHDSMKYQGWFSFCAQPMRDGVTL